MGSLRKRRDWKILLSLWGGEKSHTKFDTTVEIEL